MATYVPTAERAKKINERIKEIFVPDLAKTEQQIEARLKLVTDSMQQLIMQQLDYYAENTTSSATLRIELLGATVTVQDTELTGLFLQRGTAKANLKPAEILVLYEKKMPRAVKTRHALLPMVRGINSSIKQIIEIADANMKIEPGDLVPDEVVLRAIERNNLYIREGLFAESGELPEGIYQKIRRRQQLNLKDLADAIFPTDP